MVLLLLTLMAASAVAPGPGPVVGVVVAELGVMFVTVSNNVEDIWVLKIDLASLEADDAVPTRMKSDDDSDVSFNLAVPGAAVAHVATGLLNNLPLDADGHGPMQILRPLKVRNYRGLGSLDSYKVLAELGTVAHSEVLLFMEWCWHWAAGIPNNVTDMCTAAHMPGANGSWSRWESHLRGVVQRKLALRKQTPSGPAIWWDVWNEPNGARGSVFWPPGANCNFTQCLPDAHFLELWRRAVVTLRAADPDPVIVGPSTDGFDWAYLTEFLLYCRDNDVMPDVINWHELLPGSNGSDIPAHHAQMRAWLTENNMNASLPFAHNEIVPATAHLIPAQTLGHIAGVTASGAVGCVHSNWGPALPCNSSSGPANGLLTCTQQQPPLAPRAVFHVFAAYANMSGSWVPAQRHCDDCAALCSLDTATRTVQLIAGYYNGWQCVPATGKCNASAAAPSRTISVSLSGIMHAINTSSVHVTIENIPNTGSNALAAPLSIHDAVVPVASDGTLVLALNASLNAVLIVVLRPADSGDSARSARRGGGYPRTATAKTSAAQTCSARSFGAKGDRVTLDTAAIQRAIAACSSLHIDGQPRSKVLLTNGTFVSGPIRLLSNVELFIGVGATLLSTDDIEQWPWCKLCSQWPHCADSADFPCIDTSAIPFITALNAVNIAITGEDDGTGGSLARPDSNGSPKPGTPVIDGRGETWMAANFNRNTSNKTLHDLLHKHRPHVIQLVNCSRVHLAGFFIHDSPMYHISMYRGSGFEINNLILFSPAAATSSIGYFNTDGIDIGAEYVHVKNVYVHNGDDSIIVKGRYPEAAPPSAACFGGRHVLVENCTATGGLGIGLGTGSFTAVNITYRDILIGDTFGGSSGGPGIHMKSHDDSQSGSVRDVLFERIQMQNVGKAIDVSNRNQDFFQVATGAKKQHNGAPLMNTYDNVTFRDISVQAASYAYHFDCVGDAPCTNFVLSNVSIKWTVKKWDQCANVSGSWRDVSPSLQGCFDALRRD